MKMMRSLPLLIGKKFTVRRTTLAADPKSRLGDWFKTQNARGIPQDKAGNYFLDRDGKSFRYILAYLRLKKEGSAISFALPLKPDELAKLIGEAEALKLQELKDLCLEMLQVRITTIFIYCLVLFCLNN